MTEINSEDFGVLINTDFSFIYITAVWCGPCKAFSPIVSEISEIYKDSVTFGKLDADQNSSKLEELKVKSLPTVLIFKNGVEIERLSGASTKQSLINVLEILLAESGNFNNEEDF